jgi:acyl carrier protein
MRSALTLLTVLLFPLAVLAQEVVVAPSPDDLASFAQVTLDAVQHKNWGLLASLGVVVLVWALRKWGSVKIPFLATDRGGAVLALVWGIAGAIATGLLAGAPLDLALLIKGLTVGVTAIGVFSGAKKLATATKAGEAAAAPVTDTAAAVKVLNGPTP